MTRAAFRRDWNESGLVRRLFDRLNNGTEISSEGGITFRAEDFKELFFLLADCVVFPEDITRSDVSSISYRAFIDLRKNGPVDSRALLKEVAQKIAELRSEPRHVYIMWSKMRLRQMPFAKTVRFEFNGVKIRTAAYLPKWLRLDEYFVSGVGRVKPSVLPFFGYIIFTVEARNENEAAKRIFDACDKLYAVVNTAWRSIELWVQRRPTAKLWLGPNQFFFRGRKFLGEGRVWYNPDYDEDTWNLFPPDAGEFRRRAPMFRRVLSRLDKHPLQEPLSKALVLISEGMTSRDLALRLMRFWSALEVLYSEGEERTNVKKLISRLTFAAKEEVWLDRLKLQRVYHLRNSYVHSGSRESDDSSLVQHLREMLLVQIYYYIFNASDISSHKELLLMVDLPTDENLLDRQVLAIERRRNLLRTGRHLPVAT